MYRPWPGHPPGAAEPPAAAARTTTSSLFGPAEAAAPATTADTAAVRLVVVAGGILELSEHAHGRSGGTPKSVGAAHPADSVPRAPAIAAPLEKEEKVEGVEDNAVAVAAMGVMVTSHPLSGGGGMIGMR